MSRYPSAAHLQQDAVLVVGGLRALLLQLAHPAVGHGVARHSDFATDPMRRLWHTLGFLAIVAAGDDEVVGRFARSVAAAHRPVVSPRGVEPIYDARDPALQFWVAATIHDTAIRVTEAVHGPLPPGLADELLARSGRVGTTLGMPAGRWPATRAEFDRRFEEVVRSLAFDGTTLDVARTLLAARATPWWVRLLMPAAARLTLPTLPPGVAEPLRSAVGSGSPRLATVRRLAPLVRALPGPVRRLPAHLVVLAARRAVRVHRA